MSRAERLAGWWRHAAVAGLAAGLLLANLTAAPSGWAPCALAAGVALAGAASRVGPGPTSAMVATGLAAIAAVAALAGLGNSVFHPADFTVLNHRVSPPRLGHAFSVHGLSGNLGWAAAPIFLTSIAAAAGWRSAALGASIVARGNRFVALRLGWEPLKHRLPALRLGVLSAHPIAA